MATIHWDELRTRHADLGLELANPALDSTKRHTLQKQYAHLTKLLDAYTAIEVGEQELVSLQQESRKATDPAMKELFDQEAEQFQRELSAKKQALDEILYPPNEHDDRSVYLEVRSGTGGQEAALFAADLLKMYTNYALSKHWKVNIESTSTTDLGGIREVVLYIKGKQVFGHLKHESGVHRVQRVPSTEASGRIHTSTATVAVLPEAEEVDVSINPTDLRIDVYRSGGAGGQHVNTTDSAVRITHIPTGTVVACQDERSQHKNKAKAMKMLQSRILAAQLERQQAQMSQQRKELVGTGQRAEKVRTYNFPQNRVTDHQVELTLNRLDMVIAGDLDEIVQALRAKDAEERRKQSPLLSIG